MNVLYVYNSTENVALETSDAVYVYALNTGSICADKLTCLNDGARLNDIALELKDDYCSYIYSLNKLFIENDLLFEKDFSLFFISDLSNKRIDLFDTYSTICHIKLIEEKMKDTGIERIITDGCSREFIAALETVFPGQQCEHRNRLRQIAGGRLKRLLTPIFFYCASFIKIVGAFGFSIPSRAPETVENCFLTLFPLHLTRAGDELKYGPLVTKGDLLLTMILVDGMHQNVTIGEYWNAVKEVQHLPEEVRAVLLDRFVSCADILQGLVTCYKLYCQKPKLKRKRYCFKGVDITSYIARELDISFKRIPRLLMYRNAIKRVFEQYKVKHLYYYAHEFCLGRWFTYMVARHFPEVERIGFQHGGPFSKRKINFLLAKEEVAESQDFIHHLPMPNRVLCEDIYAKEVYEEAGYKNVTMMSRVYRLHYLESVKREHVLPNTVLISCGLHDGLFMLESLREEICQEQEKRYIIKLHPKTNLESIKSVFDQLPTDNVAVADKHIKDYYEFVGEVISSSTSSVGYEAYSLGIPVRELTASNSINVSPLQDIMKKG